MDRIRDHKNVILSIVCVLLLLLSWAIYSDGYQKLPMFNHKVITIGIFSDSYWEVQNGYSYKILEDAVRIFEEQNPVVRVEYVSGILKEYY